MPTELRPAHPDEASALDVLRRQAIEATYSDHVDRSEFADLVATPDAALAERIANPDWRVIVAATDHAQAGYAVLDRDRRRVTGIYVAPHRQREGLGSALLDRLLDDHPVRASAPTPVVEFFEANAFERTDEYDDLTGSTWNGLDAVPVRQGDTK
ncbi:MAG: N-acetyltransferase family protein [Halococcoides sp.]